MANVYMPNRQNNSSLLQLIGMGAGAALGGAGGAALGGNIGGVVAGAQPQGAAPVQASQSAIDRRMQSQTDDRLQSLREGALAVSSADIPDELRKEYVRPIYTAYQAEAKARGVKNPWEGFPDVG